MSMKLDTPVGAKVRFAGRNGNKLDLSFTKRILEQGRVYTVQRVHIGKFSSNVELKEIKGYLFNTVLFTNAREKKGS